MFHKIIFCLSILLLSPSFLFAETSQPRLHFGSSAPSSPVTVPKLSIAPPPHFPAYLKNLTNAKTVVLGPVGDAAACDEQCEAYIEAFRQKSAIRKELE